MEVEVERGCWRVNESVDISLFCVFIIDLIFVSFLYMGYIFVCVKKKIK